MAASTNPHIGKPENSPNRLETGSQSRVISPLAACALDEIGLLFVSFTKHLTSCVHSDAWFSPSVNLSPAP